MEDLGTTFWIKFAICFIIFAILPVWVFNFVELSFMMKVMFSVAGAGGAFIALQGKSLNMHKKK